MKYVFICYDDPVFLPSLKVGFPEECSTIQWDVIAAMLEVFITVVYCDIKFMLTEVLPQIVLLYLLVSFMVYFQIILHLLILCCSARRLHFVNSRKLDAVGNVFLTIDDQIMKNSWLIWIDIFETWQFCYVFKIYLGFFFSRFINNLLQFYKPSSQQFCTIELNNPMAKKLSEIGLLWIDFLLANIVSV